jgi:glycosyltransferase involved in cell wall biosynthesis
MSTPRFSIIVPCYNQAHYLPEAVASVVQQTCAHWEIIIVDDSSPDNTAEVANQLIATYPDHEIQLLQQANTGLAGARNAGIRVARGDLIITLDADDRLEPETLERTLAVFATRPQIGFVFGNVRLFDGVTGHVINRPYDARRLRFSCMLHSMSPFRRAAWEHVGGYRTSMGRGYEDWDFWLSLAEAGWQGQYLPVTLAAYRRTTTSKLSRDQHYDLELRAMLIANHMALYPSGFQRWAKRVRTAPWSAGDAIQPGYWWRAFGWYNLLIARYAARELPRTLLRPLYWRLPERMQTILRRIGREIFR